MRAFWSFYVTTVLSRAFHDTLASSGFRLPQSLIFPLVFMLGFVGLVYYRGWSFAVDELTSQVFLAFIPVGILAMILFAYNLVMAPIRIWQNQRQAISGKDNQIADLQRQVVDLQQPPTAPPLHPAREPLIQILREGNGLLATALARSRVFPFSSDLELTRRVQEWAQRLLNILNQDFPEYVPEYLAIRLEQTGLAEYVGPSTGEVVELMNRRLSIVKTVLGTLDRR